MTTKAAMEFWIKQAWRGHNSGTRYPDDIRTEPMHSEYIHVIEYSAYEELIRQNEIMGEALMRMCGMLPTPMMEDDEVPMYCHLVAKVALSKCGKGGRV